VSIIVGIVVGTAVFRTPTLVFQNVAGPWQALGAWLLGGVLCVFGALCYAELATAYPRNGGDYEYLSRAYGRWMGFLFSWAQLAVILTGSIGVMAYALADYGANLWPIAPGAKAAVAAGAIVFLSALNLLGLTVGKTAQNILTATKVLGLGGVVAAGLWSGNAVDWRADGAELMGPGLGLAMVFVLYAYGGWNDAAFIAAEVRDQHRNMPRALVVGIAAITVVYLAVNAAYLAVLGFDGVRESFTPAADVLQRAVGPWGAKAISVLVMISALGAINGMILAGSRVYATTGEDHRLFARLGRWNSRSVPAAAVVVQALFALGLVLAVGTEHGQQAIDRTLGLVGLPALPWAKYYGGFDTLLAGTAPVFWAFFLLTGVALFVLRIKDGDRPRPFSAPLYPLTPLVFCATCVYMLYSSLDYARTLSLIGLVPLGLGLVLYLVAGGKWERE
jgi:amino acid transporter